MLLKRIRILKLFKIKSKKNDIPDEINRGETMAIKTAQILGGNVKVGKWTYAGNGSRVWCWNPDDKVIIGKFCSIADNVQIFGGGEHGHKKARGKLPLTGESDKCQAES